MWRLSSENAWTWVLGSDAQIDPVYEEIGKIYGIWVT